MSTLAADNPTFSVLYDSLRLDSRASSLFWVFFLLRRLLVSLSLTVLKDYQAIQIHALSWQHLGFLTYLVIVRPFAQNIENYKLIMNELLSASATLHLFAFSSAYDLTPEVKSSASWSFVGVFSSIMVINLLVAAIQTGDKVFKIVMVKVRLWRHNRRVREKLAKKGATAV